MLNLASINCNLGMVDNSKLKGQVRIVQKDTNGSIINDTTVPNNIVIGIRKPIMKLLAGAFTDKKVDLPFVNTLKLGSSNKAVSVEDTGLNSLIEHSEARVIPPIQISSDGLRATFAFAYSAANEYINYTDDNKVTIREMGLFTSDDTMVAHTVVGSWQKQAGVYFEVYWTIGYSVGVEDSETGSDDTYNDKFDDEVEDTPSEDTNGTPGYNPNDSCCCCK